MQLRPDVEQAIRSGGAVVALESTVISHGLPYPENLQAARNMQEAVRSEGAIPATIAVLSGEAIIGLDEAQLEYLAQAKGVRKCSTRDLPIVIAKRLDGATTVSATMALAHRSGIAVFATGGIGGVHRGHPFDISADLEELARTPMIVVCAGAKALLDLEATRERLETLGVPVVGWGTAKMPAFYSRESDFAVDVTVHSVEEVTAIARARNQLGLSAALLLTVPVTEVDEWPQPQAEWAIAQAIQAANDQGIRGEAVTPFLLGRIADLSNGRSLRANLSLLVNNACVGARVAAALARRS